jgi:hypothetical protein
MRQPARKVPARKAAAPLLGAAIRRSSNPTSAGPWTGQKGFSRPCKLTPAQESAIRALVGTRSLRALAAEFRVSHETVRSILRAPETAETAP